MLSFYNRGTYGGSVYNSALSSKFAFEYCTENRSPKPSFILGVGFYFLINIFYIRYFSFFMLLGFMRRSQRRASCSLIEASLTFENKPSQNHLPNRTTLRVLFLFWVSWTLGYIFFTQIAMEPDLFVHLNSQVAMDSLVCFQLRASLFVQFPSITLSSVLGCTVVLFPIISVSESLMHFLCCWRCLVVYF